MAPGSNAPQWGLKAGCGAQDAIQGLYLKYWVKTESSKGGCCCFERVWKPLGQHSFIFVNRVKKNTNHKGEQTTQLIKNKLLWVLKKKKVILSTFNDWWFCQKKAEEKQFRLDP